MFDYLFMVALILFLIVGMILIICMLIAGFFRFGQLLWFLTSFIIQSIKKKLRILFRFNRLTQRRNQFWAKA